MGFSFNSEFDGYVLSVISYRHSGANAPFNSVIVSHPKFTELLAAAEDLGSVTELKIGRLRIEDEDIKHINGLRRLRSLQFVDNQLSPPILSKLRLGDSLKCLYLVHSNLNSLPKFDPANSVIDFDASGNLIDNDLIEQIAQSFPHLVTLHLNRTRISGASLQQFAKMKNLNELNLYGTSVNADDLREFSKRESSLQVHIEKEKIPKESIPPWSDSSFGVIGKVSFNDDRGLERDNRGKVKVPVPPRVFPAQGDSFEILPVGP